MEFKNYEFELLHILSDSDMEPQIVTPGYDATPECQLLEHAFVAEQAVAEHVPISVIRNSLLHLEE